jgi:hypothetical protein
MRRQNAAVRAFTSDGDSGPLREPSRSAARGQSAVPRLGRKLRDANRQCRPPSGNLDFRRSEDPDTDFVQLVNSVMVRSSFLDRLVKRSAMLKPPISRWRP